MKFTGQGGRAMSPIARAGIAAAATLLLIVPALWNGFPLLEYDTGGYLARWYEGYLVPSRPAAYGLLLNAGSMLDFWPVVIAQAAVTVWVLSLVMQIYGLRQRPYLQLAVFIALAAATTLPWITSILLTDIFVGLAVLALHLLVFKYGELSRWQRAGLIVLVAFSIATHSATLLLMIALGIVMLIACRLTGRLPPSRVFPRVAGTITFGVVLLLSANFVIAGKIAWTPGGYGIVFGRLLEDGIVGKYLERHCPDPRLRLCEYRNELPHQADVFLWGNEIFDNLGRFDGLGEEMRTIVLESLTEYPWLQIKTAAWAAVRQLLSVKSGEGVGDDIWHTYGMIELYTPWNLPAMRAARQQHGGLHFETLNLLHVPVALGAMALLLVPVLTAMRRRRATDLELLAASVAIAILLNAGILGPLSNPHPRYGARIVWIAPFVIALWAIPGSWLGRNGEAPAGGDQRAPQSGGERGSHVPDRRPARGAGRKARSTRRR